MPGPRGRVISKRWPAERCGAISTDRLPTCQRRSTGPQPGSNFAQWGTRRLVASVHEGRVGGRRKALRICPISESTTLFTGLRDPPDDLPVVIWAFGDRLPHRAPRSGRAAADSHQYKSSAKITSKTNSFSAHHKAKDFYGCTYHR
jgi:hypothetical protein